MTGLRVRAAVVEDADAVLRLHIEARTSYYRGFLDEAELAAQNRRDVADYARMIRSPDRVVRCAELDGELAGFLVLGPPYHPDPDPAVGGELYQIHVHPELHGRGIGTRLHEAAVAIWGTTGARLWVWEFNERARRFYLARGWWADGRHRPDDPRVGGYRMIGYRLGAR